jgi:muramoyltetrapeptide carboxypeptidase
MKFIPLLVIALLAAVLPAHACDYCLCAQGLAPAMSNEWSLRFDARYLDLGTRMGNGTVLSNPLGQAEKYLTGQLSVIVPLWSGNASLFVGVPFSSRSTVGGRIDDGDGFLWVRPDVHNSGLGDILALVRYRVWDKMTESSVVAAAFTAGFKTPTGSVGATDANGIRLDAHLQSGTGSWDPMLGGNVFVSEDAWAGTVNVLAAFPGAGANGYRFGTTLNYDLTAAFNAVYSTATRPGLFLTVGLTGETTAKESADGVVDDNTGGTTLWAVPGLRVDLSNVIVDAGVHVPVYRRLNGDQLAGTIRATAGVQYHFAILPGDTIGIVSPASPERTAGRVARGAAYLRALGYRVVMGKHVGKRNGYLAGSDEERAADMNVMIANPSVRAIMCTRGGYGSTRILSLLDYDGIKRDPKIFVGFSDTTAVNLALLAKADLVSFNGAIPGVDLWREPVEKFTEASFWQMMRGEPTTGTAAATVIMTGRLVGGTLTLVASLIGTPFLPRVRKPIWVFEDVSEEPYRIDRMLQQCSNAGLFKNAAGVVFGAFTHCVSTHKGTQSVNDVIDEFSQRHSIPVVRDIPFGHVRRKLTLPIGARVSVAADGTIATR